LDLTRLQEAMLNLAVKVSQAAYALDEADFSA
jgi:hypothetical protein